MTELLQRQASLRVRSYGSSGPLVVVLHGGPGVAGYVAPVARGLAGSFRVLEPFQRASESEPLTVARHVADLHEIVASRGEQDRPALVGHSWGAMLALAFAAAHPDHVSALVLVGCGPFDPVARHRLVATREARLNDRLRRRLERLTQEVSDPDRRLFLLGSLMRQVDSCELLPGASEVEVCDARAHEQTWQDMLRLQEEGVYPAAFAAIKAPVLMLHGAQDPHPGDLIRASLEPFLPQMSYLEWERCGHYPWLERAVHHEFFAVLCEWLKHPGARTPGKSL